MPRYFGQINNDIFSGHFQQRYPNMGLMNMKGFKCGSVKRTTYMSRDIVFFQNRTVHTLQESESA